MDACVSQANFISLKPSASAADSSSLPGELAPALASAMAHLGPHLARSLVHNIGGNAARSELDKVCEPLKKLVALRPEAHAWLERALLDETFPGAARVSVEERGVFLRKVIG